MIPSFPPFPPFQVLVSALHFLSFFLHRLCILPLRITKVHCV